VGTSKGYGGPSGGLVPSWIDEPTPGGEPTYSPAPAASGMPQQPGVPGPPIPVTPGVPTQPINSIPSAVAVPAAPVAPDSDGTSSLAVARSNFTRFARSASRPAMGRALSSYIRSGTGGARRAARRMGASRATGGRLLGVIRDVQSVGPTEALRRRRLDLASLAAQPAPDVMLALLDFVCPPGAAIDEAISRQAMLDAIQELADTGAGSFETLTPDQLEAFFLDFVAFSIERRVINDIGTRSITLPEDVAAVRRAQDQLHDFISGRTRTELAGRTAGIVGINDQALESIVTQIYETAFEIIAVAAEAEL
jgi:hypothetical protein